MGQPKKLTFKQRKQRVLDEKLSPVLKELRFILKELRGDGDVNHGLWRKKALDVFRWVSDSSEFPQADWKVQRYIEWSLQLAREAQGAMDFAA